MGPGVDGAEVEHPDAVERAVIRCRAGHRRRWSSTVSLVVRSPPPRGTAHAVTDPATTRPPRTPCGAAAPRRITPVPYFAAPASGTLVGKVRPRTTPTSEKAAAVPRKIILDCDPGHDDADRAAARPRQPGDRAARGDHRRREPDPREGHPQRARRSPASAASPACRSPPVPRPLVRRAVDAARDIHGESGLDGPVLPEPTRDARPAARRRPDHRDGPARTRPARSPSCRPAR